MALSPVAGTVHRTARPATLAEPSSKGGSTDGEVGSLSSSNASASPSQIRPMSLADVISRQQAANASTRDASADTMAEESGIPIRQRFEESFSAAAADPQAFNDLLTRTFGNNFDKTQAEAFRQSALRGDFSFLPSVEYVDVSVLQGGNGAYSADTNTIYINQDLKGTELGAQTFVEEAGHFLDSRLNSSDTRGDEGEMFRRLLSGESLSRQAEEAIRSEDDSGTIIVDGKSVDVEFFSLGGFFGGIGDAIGNAASGIADGFSNAVDSVVDTVGNFASNVAETVGDVATSVGNFAGDVVSGAGNAVGGFFNTVGTAIGGDFGNALSSTGNRISGAGNWLGNTLSSSVGWFNDNVFQPVVNTGIEWVQDVAPILTGIATAPIRVLGNTLDGTGETLGALLQGDFSGAWGSFRNTVREVIRAPAELAVTTIALGANTAVNAVNNLFSLTTERGLNREEREYLEQIFGNSIEYDRIRIQSGGIKEWLGISPQTTGNDIFLRQQWGGSIFNSDGTLTEAGLDLLGHEAGHVWQNQNGGITYVGDALITQGLDAIGIGDGYAIEQALRSGTRFEDMNPEQQASVAEFIGMAIRADANGQLTVAGFENASGISNLTPAEFAIVQAAHDTIRE